MSMETKRKCSCDEPLCRKCLTINCEDDYCKVRTIANKLKSKRQVLANLFVIKQKVEDLIAKKTPKEELEILYDFRRLPQINKDIELYENEILRLSELA